MRHYNIFYRIYKYEIYLNINISVKRNTFRKLRFLDINSTFYGTTIRKIKTSQKDVADDFTKPGSS